MMAVYYDPSLVALSFAVAVIASYTALDLAGRVGVSASNPKQSWVWLTGGAVSMGTGIWSMHFIAMLAFHLPVPVAYDLRLTLRSMSIAIVASAIALYVLGRPRLGARNLIVGATLMGIGISTMHYTGMMAMQMSPPIRYDPLLVAASVLVAVAASFASLSIAFQLRSKHSRLAILAKLGSAGVMGLAITGMHYTGMAAAQFAPDSICLAAASGGIDNTSLAFVISGITSALLGLTLIVSAIDAHFAATNARLAHSLLIAKEAADAALLSNERITHELRAAQVELLATARQAGMAEIANNVLHNVGNVLNSVNVSAGLIGSTMRDSKAHGLAKAVHLMNEHSADLGDFLTRDEKGKLLPGYLNKAVAALALEQQSVVEELGSLAKSVDHIKDIVATQQSYAGAASVVEAVQIRDLLEDALRMNVGAMTRHRVTVVKEFEDVPLLLLDKSRVLQILVNLISNAKQAMDGVRDRAHRMTLRVDVAGLADERRLRIRVEDNGEGIPPENLPQLFVHGFTTRKNGHGFGLHSCALTAKEMGGTLTANSDGPGKGATFTLELPTKPGGHIR
jgi:NO-binding membrane sensor protein with MHYT domain